MRRFLGMTVVGIVFFLGFMFYMDQVDRLLLFNKPTAFRAAGVIVTNPNETAVSIMQKFLFGIEAVLVGLLLATAIDIVVFRGLGFRALSRTTLAGISTLVAVAASVIVPMYAFRLLWGGIPDLGLPEINPDIFGRAETLWLVEIMAYYLLAMAMSFIFRNVANPSWGAFNMATSAINAMLVWSAIIYYCIFTYLFGVANYELTPMKMYVMRIWGPLTAFDVMFSYMAIRYLPRGFVEGMEGAGHGR
ncbi:MAG: hypothetical protein JWO43_179 [Candidatus Adlerbacteria bacterium]|nr:hypothetical protein [Candidatus Adlerbacteria bacterium]